MQSFMQNSLRERRDESKSLFDMTKQPAAIINAQSEIKLLVLDINKSKSLTECKKVCS